VQVGGRELRQVVIRDIDQHKRLQLALTNFAHTVSHDLQEPLRTVTGFARLLARRHGAALGEDGGELLEEIEANASTMRSLIADLLRAAKKGGAAVDLAPVATEEVVQEAISSLGRRIEEREATLSTSALPPVLGSRTQILQLFINLLGNALQHGGHGVEIHVTGVEEENEVRLTVRDDGPGIPAARREEAFQAFRPGPGSRGTGLGLATCRQIVHRHGGAIWLEETGPHGTSVSFTLPAAGSPSRSA
ncbi:MAG: ATP-binding protein, partial [Candidatus Thermoplasmatota archaeon]|nr:ATP-binding protein [Candidatus Thermoplasmatota archaeon]